MVGGAHRVEFVWRDVRRVGIGSPAAGGGGVRDRVAAVGRASGVSRSAAAGLLSRNAGENRADNGGGTADGGHAFGGKTRGGDIVELFVRLLQRSGTEPV